jgi:hypothetical protein
LPNERQRGINKEIETTNEIAIQIERGIQCARGIK